MESQTPPLSLPPETVQVSKLYEPANPTTAKTIQDTRLQERAASAEQQRIFLTNLNSHVRDTATMLGPYLPHVRDLQSRDLKEPSKDRYALELKSYFSDGSEVLSVRLEDKNKYVVFRPGQNGLASYVLILERPKRHAWGCAFTLERLVLFNPDLDRAIDMVSVSRSHGYGNVSLGLFDRNRVEVFNQKRIDADKKGQLIGSVGGTHPGLNRIEVSLASEEGVFEFMPVFAHEIGHSLQDESTLPESQGIVETGLYLLSGLAGRLFPSLGKKFFPDVVKSRQYKKAIQDNLSERNASAFMVAFIRTLRSLGINMATNNQLALILKRHKIFRTEADIYGPAALP